MTETQSSRQWTIAFIVLLVLQDRREKYFKNENDFLNNVLSWNTIDQSSKWAVERTAGRQEHAEFSILLSKGNPWNPVEGRVNKERMFPVNIQSQGNLDFTQALIKYSSSTTPQTKPTTHILQNQVAILSSLKLFLISWGFFTISIPIIQHIKNES